MGFKCGIVGLPNVGKSTLFNALTQTAAAQAANYPFCTIEPNVGDVAVPDVRLEALAKIAGSREIIPTRLTFVDIAGLVRGASKGEGLGNQFLANIRECDAIAHVVRCFEDSDITHVEGKIDPIGDIEIIETELMLADLESLEKRIVPLEKKAKGGDKDAKELYDLLARCLIPLREGKPARTAKVSGCDEVVCENCGATFDWASARNDIDAAELARRQPLGEVRSPPAAHPGRHRHERRLGQPGGAGAQETTAAERWPEVGRQGIVRMVIVPLALSKAGALPVVQPKWFASILTILKL